MLQLILLIFLLLYAIALIIYFLIPLTGSAPYYPSHKNDMKKMLEVVTIKRKDKVIDLGSGDGRLLMQLAKHSNNVWGIELNPVLSFYSKLRVLLAWKRNKIHIVTGSFFKHDLSQYDIVFCYLYPGVMQKLLLKFEKELKPGTKVIVNCFAIKDRKPIKESGKILVYEF